MIGNSFSFYFISFIRFTSLRIGCITRINKRYKYKMQMKYISFKDFIVIKTSQYIRCFSGVCLNIYMLLSRDLEVERAGAITNCLGSVSLSDF